MKPLNIWRRTNKILQIGYNIAIEFALLKKLPENISSFHTVENNLGKQFLGHRNRR
jgi:hypothetical protein